MARTVSRRVLETPAQAADRRARNAKHLANCRELKDLRCLTTLTAEDEVRMAELNQAVDDHLAYLETLTPIGETP